MTTVEQPESGVRQSEGRMETSSPPAKPGMKRRWMLAILALTFLFVLMPFLFWQATWFGKPLGVEQLQQALADSAHPREIQHALSQIADRILAPDEPTRQSVRQFYPAVMRIAETGTPELRLTAAWVMGQDNTFADFHEQLLRLLRDASPMVRRNAALGLVRFGDPSGRDEIRALLAPYSMPAPYSGTLETRLKPDDAVNPGTLFGHIQVSGSDGVSGSGAGPARTAGNEAKEFRSDVPGAINRWLVPDGGAATAGEPLVLIDPSPSEVWEALRALYLIGQPQDLPAVEQFLHGGDAVPLNVRQQAEVTAAAIRARQ